MACYPPYQEPLLDPHTPGRISMAWYRFFTCLSGGGGGGPQKITLIGSLTDDEGTGDLFGIPGVAGDTGPTGATGAMGLIGPPGPDGDCECFAWPIVGPPGASGSSDDYVVMSDGANPPSAIDDGNGNFIYITYAP